MGCNSYLLPTKCLQEQEWQWCQRWSDCQTWISGDRKWPLSDTQFCALPHTAKQCPTALQSATQCHSMPRMSVVRRSNRRRRSMSGGELITAPIGHLVIVSHSPRCTIEQSSSTGKTERTAMLPYALSHWSAFCASTKSCLDVSRSWLVTHLLLDSAHPL